jgi:hypothetical protein
MFRKILGLSVLAILVNFNFGATAGVLDWNFNFTLSNGDVGSGVFVTEDSPAGGPYLITAIQNGSLSGFGSMALLAPGVGGPVNQIFNDNLLSPSIPELDGNGFGFTTAGNLQWSIWGNGSSVSNWCSNGSGGADHYCSWDTTTGVGDPHGSVTSFAIAAVPEPSTWVMILLGFAGAGFVASRRKSKPALIAV